MPTREEIDAAWEPLHAKLTRLYYEEENIDRKTFEKLHSAIWLFHEKQSIEAGILSDHVVDEQSGKLRSIQIAEIIEQIGGEKSLRDLIDRTLR